MTSVEPLLSPIRTRLEAVTPGPWRTWKDNDGRRGAAAETAWAHDADGADTELITDWCSTPVAEFIASAPTDISKLLAAVDLSLAYMENRANALRGTADGLNQMVLDRQPDRDQEAAIRYEHYALEAASGVAQLRAAVTAALEGEGK